MGEVIKDETSIERVNDKIRITRLMVEDFGPQEYIENLNGLIVKVNKYAEDLKHDTGMRDVWMEGRPLAIKIRDEFMEKHGIADKEIKETKTAKITGDFGTFQKDQLKRKIASKKNKRGVK